jgi:hypothetical protein
MSNDLVPYGEGLMVFIERTPRAFVGNGSEQKFEKSLPKLEIVQRFAGARKKLIGSSGD